MGPGADQGGQHREAEVARREAEAARREDGGQEAAVQATATVMGTVNAAPPPSRDLATTITTTTVNDHVAGDAAVGAVGIVNDGDMETTSVADTDPAGSARRKPWSSRLRLRPGSLRTTPMVATAASPSSAARLRKRSRGRGRRRWAAAAAAAIMLTLREQFLTTTAATRWARRGAFDTAIAASTADERRRRERMGLRRLLDMYYIQSHSQQRHRGGLGILIPSFWF